MPVCKDYDIAILNASVCFKDADIRASSPFRDSRGDVYSDNGAVAIVYRMDRGSESHAVRCFLSDNSPYQERYEKISEHLHKVQSPYFVEFRYLSDEVLAAGSRWPIVKMDWVEGPNLDKCLIAGSEEPRCLAEKLRAMAWELHSCDIAHGDLQHGNVKVQGGEFVLVDYDGICVPALEGERPLENGHPNYNHPGRRAVGGLSLEADRFPGIVIYVSLLAHAEMPDLIQNPAYHNQENLIFDRDDFEDPVASPLFTELGRRASPTLRQLVGYLAELSRGPYGNIPTLEDFIREADARSVPSGLHATRGPARAQPAAGSGQKMFNPPPPRVGVAVCAVSGILPGPTCRSRETRFFTQGDEPTAVCDRCGKEAASICQASGKLAGNGCVQAEIRMFDAGTKPRDICDVCTGCLIEICNRTGDRARPGWCHDSSHVHSPAGVTPLRICSRCAANALPLIVLLVGGIAITIIFTLLYVYRLAPIPD